MGGRGVLAIAPASGSRLTGPDQERLLDTCASLIALALERIHYVEVAQASIVEIESERLRSSLLSAVSHDIRTPLSAIVAMTESLSSLLSSSRSDVNALLQSIRGGALRMGAQVSNLLDMARLHAGRVQLGRQWLPVEEAVGSAIRAMSRTLAPERVRVVLPDDLPVINVDPALFERVLCNLLENAAKFTPPQSEIVISASLSGARIAIVFEDEGPGLPPQKEEAIFQMFERGNRDSPIPGVGLGLAICRAIVEAHGGAIRGENRARRGARFLIELPLETQPVWDSMDDEKEIEESL
jgi:two-component system sensor histidine kinase KdpD